MGKNPSVADLNLASVRSTNDLRLQADILRKIADVKMNEYMVDAPESVRKLQDKGLPKEVIFGVGGTAVTVTALSILLIYGAQILSAFVSVLQPLYYTYKALETQQKDDDTIWLTYWMVHGVLFMVESTILFPIVNALPGLYFIVKMAVQFWMVNFQGSTVIYQRFLAPFFRKHEQELEEKMELYKREALAAAGLAKPVHKPAGEDVTDEEVKAAEDDI